MRALIATDPDVPSDYVCSRLWATQAPPGIGVLLREFRQPGECWTYRQFGVVAWRQQVQAVHEEALVARLVQDLLSDVLRSRRHGPPTYSGHVIPLAWRHDNLDDLGQAVPSAEHHGESVGISIADFADCAQDVEQVIPPRVDPALHPVRIAQSERQGAAVDTGGSRHVRPFANEVSEGEPLRLGHNPW
jgi:hypothetical protein